MPLYRVDYIIWSGNSLEPVSNSNVEIDTPDAKKVGGLALDKIANTDSMHDPRIDPRIEITKVSEVDPKEKDDGFADAQSARSFGAPDRLIATTK